MQRSRNPRTRLLAAAAMALLFMPAAVPAHAVSKEIVELQTQVQQLMDMVQRLQSTLDARMGVLQHLAEQTADQANQTTTSVNTLQQKLNSQNEAISGKVDTVSGQVQSLNDSVDELKARIAKLDKTVQDLQAQVQSLQNGQMPQSGMQGQPQGSGQTPGLTGQPGNPGAGQAQGAPGAMQAPPLQEALQAGIRDFNAGRSQVAQGEFQDVVHYYPLDDLAGTAHFYIGEIAYQQQNYPAAINEYNSVLEGFSGNSKAATAQLHKGLALLAMNKREEGIHELRSLIQRHPQSPEARAARSKLNGMGVKITSGH